ncbi:hypothetical protein ACLB2K_012538 [Fragaria x ananassa]
MEDKPQKEKFEVRQGENNNGEKELVAKYLETKKSEIEDEQTKEENYKSPREEELEVVEALKEENSKSLKILLNMNTQHTTDILASSQSKPEKDKRHSGSLASSYGVPTVGKNGHCTRHGIVA